MKWVSNMVPVTKKQGTIRVCADFLYLNLACPKDNYPTPFIDQIIDECAGNEILSFMEIGSWIQGSQSLVEHFPFCPLGQ